MRTPLVLRKGVEPSRPFGRGLLRPRRLPFRHLSMTQKPKAGCPASRGRKRLAPSDLHHFKDLRPGRLADSFYSGDAGYCPRVLEMSDLALTHVRRRRIAGD